MPFLTCPRVKRAKESGGVYRFRELAVFMVGHDDGRLVRTLRVLLPTLPVKHVSRDNANTVLSVASVYAAKNEYCYMRITENGLEIRARDAMGVRNAAAILAQIVRREGEDFLLPCGSVEDWPDASYRAMMLESSGRAWLSMECIYRHIYEMGLARMNVLQFHFMESPGCTIQLDCFPDLHGYGEENLKYTKDEIRAMIAYAEELGISVTPFVEVISHSVDFNVKAGVACEGDTLAHMFAVCVGREETFEKIELLLREVAELFPDPVLHIGADEYDMSAVTPLKAHWLECPHCRKMMAARGYTTLREVFLYAVERVNRIVNKLGKVTMLWNADLEPGKLPADFERNMVIHYYRPDNCLCSEKIFAVHPNGYVEDGFAVLNSHYHDTYMDFARYFNPDRLAEWSYLDAPRILPENRAAVIGGCCCAWEDWKHFSRTISPAILCFADRLWNTETPTRYDRAWMLLMTRLLFDGRLPADMNAFDVVGRPLPPSKNEEYFDKRFLFAPSAEMVRIKDALTVLADEGHLLAQAFLPICDAAIAVRREQEGTTVLRTDREEFDG